MREISFTGFLPEAKVTAEVKEAFRLLNEVGVPFWNPGPARACPLVPAAMRTGEKGYLWVICGEAPLEEKVTEYALTLACGLLAAYVPRLEEAAIQPGRAVHNSRALQIVRDGLLARAREEVGRG